MQELKNMFEFQKNLQKAMFNHELPKDSVEDFKYSLLALISELGEVLEADKRWKNIRSNKLNREAKLEELVDCQAFLINMILFSGIDFEEFYKAFFTKYIINLKRIEAEQNEADKLS